MKSKPIFLWMLINLTIRRIYFNVTASDRIAKTNTTFDEALDQVFRNYYKNSVPPTENNEPNIVHVEIAINSIFDVSEQSSSFKIKYFFNLLWKDSRLKFTPFIENNKTIQKIILPVDFVKRKGKSFSRYLTAQIFMINQHLYLCNLVRLLLHFQYLCGTLIYTTKKKRRVLMITTCQYSIVHCVCLTMVTSASTEIY